MTTTDPVTAKLRMLATCAALGLASVVPATAQVAPATTTDASGNPTTMSKFEVTTTQGRGYVSTNAATGFKTNQELMKIPQAVTVVTQDLIQDIGSQNASDILQYAGASDFYRGEALAIRGARINNSFVDEIPDNTPYEDAVFVDTFEVIRGPAAVLYMNASLGGAVLKTTKKPLGIDRTTITFKADEWGLFRGEFDSTAVVGNLGGGQFSYRVTAAAQGGDMYIKNMKDTRKVASPVLQFVYKDTTLRVAYDYQDMTHIPNGDSILDSSGNLFTGAGRDEGQYAPGGMEHFTRTNERIAMYQNLSPDWEFKLRANHLNFHRLGSVSLVGGVNWANDTETFTARRNKQDYDNWTMLGDLSGKYKIAGLDNISNAGFSFADELNNSRFWASPTFGTQTRNPFNPDMADIGLPTLASYVIPPANPGTRAETYRGNIYYQHTLELIPNWLELVGGVTYSNITIYNIANIATFPRLQDVTGGTKYLTRGGAVVNLGKNVALYALYSTTFTPGTSRDANGNLLPSQTGNGKEAGFKTSFFDGRLSSTFSVFDINLTNVAVNVGINSSGASYFAPVGSTTQRGFDFDLAFSIVKGWQLIATGYNGTVKDQGGNHVGNTFGQLYSLFTRYDFQDSLLKGFAVGGGWSRTAHRFVAGGGFVFADGHTQSVIEVAPAEPLAAFVSYRLNKHWLFRVNCDNVQDKNYVIGLQGYGSVDPSVPRTFTGSAQFTF